MRRDADRKYVLGTTVAAMVLALLVTAAVGSAGTSAAAKRNAKDTLIVLREQIAPR